MIRINLLPEAQRQPKWAFGRIVATSVSLVAVISILVYAYGAYSVWTLEQQIAAARSQYELLQPTREKMAAAATKQQAIQTKNNVLIALTAERRSWYGVLAHLGTVTPSDAWFIDVTSVDQNNLKISGMTKNYPDLANFLRRVEQDPFFAEPVLIKAERQGTMPATRFEISVKLKGM